MNAKDNAEQIHTAITTEATQLVNNLAGAESKSLRIVMAEQAIYRAIINYSQHVNNETANGANAPMKAGVK